MSRTDSEGSTRLGAMSSAVLDGACLDTRDVIDQVPLPGVATSRFSIVSKTTPKMQQKLPSCSLTKNLSLSMFSE